MDPFGKSGPDEPEEFDPDSLGPDVPDVEPDLEELFAAAEDVDDDLLEAFWAAAFFLNVAIAALSIGLMLVYFRGAWSSGGFSLLVGVLSAVFAARYYFGYTRGNDGGDGAASDGASGGTDVGGGTDAGGDDP